MPEKPFHAKAYFWPLIFGFIGVLLMSNPRPSTFRYGPADVGQQRLAGAGFLAISLWAAGSAAKSQWRDRRRRRRIEIGHCPNCGYDIRHSGMKCPECGEPNPAYE